MNRLHLTAMLAALLACGTPHAQTPVSTAEARWTFNGGAALVAAPRYPGSDRLKMLLVPAVQARYGEHLFIDPIRGIGLEARVAQDATASASLGIDLTTRRARDSARLRGLDDVREAAAFQVELEWRAAPVFARAGWLRRLGGAGKDGSTLDLEVGRSLAAGPVTWDGGLNFKAMDRDHARTFFAVSPAQAGRSGLPRYDAGAGLQSAGVFVQAAYPLTADWQLFGRLNLYRLASDAARSPVVESRRQNSLVLTATTAF